MARMSQLADTKEVTKMTS